MSWHRWGSCLAVVLFVGLSGCALDSVNARIETTTTATSGTDGNVIHGSADNVAVRAQAMLEGLGLKVDVQRDSAEVRLACSTASGMHFTLHLTETQMQIDGNPASQETVTRARIEWESGADDATEIRVLAGLGSLNVQ